MEVKADREWYKNDCQKHDMDCAKQQKFLEHLKRNNNERHMEKAFIEEQIQQAQDNGKKLQKKAQAL